MARIYKTYPLFTDTIKVNDVIEVFFQNQICLLKIKSILSIDLNSKKILIEIHQDLDFKKLNAGCIMYISKLSDRQVKIHKSLIKTKINNYDIAETI